MDLQEEANGQKLTRLINVYWAYSEYMETLRKNNGTDTLQQVAIIGDLRVIIYSNDHNPPHFHVISKNRSIDAKFTIENCEHLSGKLTSKQKKNILAFYQSENVKPLMEKIWSKRE